MRVTTRDVEALLKKCETNLRETEKICRKLQALVQSIDGHTPPNRVGHVATKTAVKRKPPK